MGTPKHHIVAEQATEIAKSVFKSHPEIQGLIQIAIDEGTDINMYEVPKY